MHSSMIGHNGEIRHGNGLVRVMTFTITGDQVTKVMNLLETKKIFG